MSERAKSTLRSPEEETFHRFYNTILDSDFDQVFAAKLLFDDNIISSETKDSITSDEEGKRALLDAAQHALANSSDPEKTFQSVLRAFRETCTYDVYDPVETFCAGECTRSVEANA